LKEKLKKILKFIAFATLGVLMLWLVYQKQDITVIWQGIKQAKIAGVLIALFLGILSHFSRALRWNLLIEPLGYKPRKITSFLSILVMYLTNFAFPRSGEVVRCAFVNRYEKVPFTGLLGTVLIERIVDTIILFLLAIFVALTNIGVVKDFLNNNPVAKARFENLLNSKITIAISIIAIILIIFAFYLLRNKIKQSKIYQKTLKLLKDFAQGVKSLWTMQKKWEFLAHSLFIWLMYWLMLYAMFFAFDYTRELSLMQSLTLLVLSSFGMLVPSPGGIGSWHFMTIETLFIFGIDKTKGGIFAIVAHESQMIMLVIIGLLALLGASFIKPQNSYIKPQNITENE